MDVRRMHSIPAKRLPGARKHGDVRLPNRGYNTSGIGGRLLQGSIAVHGANSQQMQRFVMRGEKNGEGILSQMSVWIWPTRFQQGEVDTSCPVN